MYRIQKNSMILLILSSLVFSSCSKLQNSVRGYMKQEKYSLIKGINAQEQGKTKESLQHFQDAYDRNPNNVFTLKQLGYIYSEIGEEDKAEEFYLKVLEKEPNDGKTLHNLGILYYRKENYTKSLEYLNQIPKISMSNEIIKLKVYDYYLLNNYVDAYNVAQDLEEEEADLKFLVIYGRILFKARKLGELHSFVTRLYEEYPDVYEVLDIYTDHLWKNTGDVTTIEAIYKAYIVRHGAEKRALLKIANVLYEEEYYSEAKKYINLVLEEDMFDGDVLELKAKIYRKNDMEKEADRIENMLVSEKE